MTNIGIKYLSNYNKEKLGEIKIDEYYNFSLKAAIEQQISLLPFVGFPYQSNDFKPKLIPTGIALNIPIGYQLIIKTNPNLIHRGIIILDSPMVIFNNKLILEIKLLLINYNSNNCIIKAGEKIAKCFLQKINEIEFIIKP